MVTSKPKRISVAAGLVHMVISPLFVVELCYELTIHIIPMTFNPAVCSIMNDD